MGTKTYDHYAYCEQVARTLKAVGHDDQRPRFFTVFGLEDLYNFEDKLSAVTGMVLIAVDGTEMDSTDNRADGITDTYTYSIILAKNTQRDRPDTIAQAIRQCQVAALQVRNLLRLDPDLQYSLGLEMQLNGIGPIGDGFYGVMLTFTVTDYPDYTIDEKQWATVMKSE